MSEMKQSIIKTTADEVIIEVEANSVGEFLEAEAQERIKVLDDIGPFGPNQAMPFYSHKTPSNIIMYIVLGLCLLSHIWARVTIGL